nr:hypothetical protein [Tanacetum cinerariifolium]
MNKSPGPDDFTFEFFHRYWKLLEHDIAAAIKEFFTSGFFSNIPIDSSLTLSHLFFVDDAIFVGVAEEEQIDFLLSHMKGLILTNIPNRWVWSLEATCLESKVMKECCFVVERVAWLRGLIGLVVDLCHQPGFLYLEIEVNANPPPPNNPHIFPTFLWAKVIQELRELEAISTIIDSRLDNIKKFLNGFALQANEIDMNEVDSSSESTNSYASDDDVIPNEKVTQELVNEISQTVDEVNFPDDIEERTSRWVAKCVKRFNPYARYEVEHWKNSHAKIFYIKSQQAPGKPKREIYSNSKIVQIIKTYWELGHEHKFITEIVARRENKSIISITESDYKNLNKNDIEDMYMLIVNHKVDDYAETGLL